MHAAGTGFAFDPIIAIAAKGKRTPIRAAPLLRRTATARLRVPLIGRDTDLATRALELFEQMGASRLRPGFSKGSEHLPPTPEPC